MPQCSLPILSLGILGKKNIESLKDKRWVLIKKNLTMEEALQRENELKLASACIMEYIKVGKGRKVFKPEDIETKRIE
jgi:hypothetical protein